MAYHFFKLSKTQCNNTKTECKFMWLVFEYRIINKQERWANFNSIIFCLHSVSLIMKIIFRHCVFQMRVMLSLYGSDA